MNNERVVELDKYEFGAVINIINEKRNNLLKENKNAEFITEILEKVINAPPKKKIHLKRERQNCER